MITLKLYIKGNDTCFEVEYCPEEHCIEDVFVSTDKNYDPAPLDIEGLFVSVGTFPDCKIAPLSEELLRLAEIAFAEYQEEYLYERNEQAAYDAGLEH